jgi:hypothetical protein
MMTLSQSIVLVSTVHCEGVSTHFRQGSPDTMDTTISPHVCDQNFHRPVHSPRLEQKRKTADVVITSAGV